VAKVDVKVPDIGDFKDVPVIEVLVKPGDVVTAEQSLVSLESDKATMDVPSPVAGTVAEVVAKVGDKVSMGTLIARIESGEGETKAEGAPAKSVAPAPEKTKAEPAKAAAPAPSKAAETSPRPKSAGTAPAKATTIDITIPDIGDFKDVPVIEVLVKAGDTVEAEQPIVTLESDKASMDVPSSRSVTRCRWARWSESSSLADKARRLRRIKTTRRMRRKKRTPPKRPTLRPSRQAICRPDRRRQGRAPHCLISRAFSLAPRFGGWRASLASISIS
jgi:biotin carboxyl carrier protein